MESTVWSMRSTWASASCSQAAASGSRRSGGPGRRAAPRRRARRPAACAARGSRRPPGWRAPRRWRAATRAGPPPRRAGGSSRRAPPAARPASRGSAGVAGVNSRASTVWTLSTPTTWSSQTSGTEHIDVKRAWSTPRIQAKRGSRWTSGLTMVERVCAARPVMPWPIASRATPTASLVEAVRGRQRHAAAVAVRQVERADVRPRGGLGAVDDRAHELVPGARRGGQVRHLGEEADLLEVRRLQVASGHEDRRADRAGAALTVDRRGARSGPVLGRCGRRRPGQMVRAVSRGKRARARRHAAAGQPGARLVGTAPARLSALAGVSAGQDDVAARPGPGLRGARAGPVRYCVHLASALAALADGPHHERLAAPHVTGHEDALARGAVAASRRSCRARRCPRRCPRGRRARDAGSPWPAGPAGPAARARCRGSRSGRPEDQSARTARMAAHGARLVGQEVLGEDRPIARAALRLGAGGGEHARPGVRPATGWPPCDPPAAWA